MVNGAHKTKSGRNGGQGATGEVLDAEFEAQSCGMFSSSSEGIGVARQGLQAAVFLGYDVGSCSAPGSAVFQCSVKVGAGSGDYCRVWTGEGRPLGNTVRNGYTGDW